MIILILVIMGLCLGSFVNALVWRLYKQSKSKKKDKQMSILSGRSVCEDCGHQLSSKDLIPLLSWLSLRGKCRYCKKPISIQNPIVELTTAVLFLASYIFWPADFNLVEYVIFCLWLAILVGLVALAVYDIRWRLLPNKVVFSLYIFALLIVVLRFVQDPEVLTVYENLSAIIVGGGLFYLIFRISKGEWIGGGDVKLGFLLGALVGRPDLAFLMLFLASLIGCLYILPLMLAKQVNRKSHIPFGPFLIASTIIVVLFGSELLFWYFDKALLSA